MPRQRANGEGMIRKREEKRKDGSVRVRWVAELMTGYSPEGKRVVWRASGKTRKEVAEALGKALDEHRKGLPIVAAKLTLGEFLRTWLADVVRPGAEPRTYIGYERIVRCHLEPTLGTVRLDQLHPRQIQALYRDKRETLSAQMVLHIHRCLHRALEFAVRWGYLARNPCDLVDAPKVADREQHSLSPEQARAFLVALQGDPLQAYWIVALTTAMRPGELAALRWRDVDLDAGRVQLQRALTRLPKQGWVEKDLKSHQGRAIALTAIAVEALRLHRVRQAEARLQAGAAWLDEGRIFANSVGKPIEPGNLLRRSFLPLLEKAGLPRIRPYDLRHSTASLLLSLGTHPKVVAELLGHGSVALTLDTYSHAAPSLQGEAIAALDRLLRPGSGAAPAREDERRTTPEG